MNQTGWVLLGCTMLALLPNRSGAVDVEVREGIPDKKSWNFTPPAATVKYTEPAFGLVALPKKYSQRGVLVDRALPILVSAHAEITLPAGTYRFLLRSRNGARLKIDGTVVAAVGFIDTRGDGHEPVPEKPTVIEPNLRLPAIGHKEKLVTVALDAGKHRFELDAFIGGAKLRPEVGELIVAVAAAGEAFRLLGAEPPVLLTDESWQRYAESQIARLQFSDDAARKTAAAGEEGYWRTRHAVARHEWNLRIVPAAATASEKNGVDHLLGAMMNRRAGAAPSVVDDWTFARRAYLDTVGVIPTEPELRQYFADTASSRRTRLVERLLADPRWADHWVSYWQDVLAENPGILKPNLNNTGPFRWWLHQALSDNYGMDRFATELVRMEGSKMFGGPAGFGMATENDAPLAAKAHILAKAFLGMEMQCARCHDAPFHPFKQRDLFELAALLGRGPQTLPAASTVHVGAGMRQPRITSSLKAGEKIEPRWPFAAILAADLPDGVVVDAQDARERFAALLTSPRNERFAEVIVNRLWKRYFGWGLVEPVDDWPAVQPETRPLLRYLAQQLGTHNYDLKHVARLLLNSRAYQSAVQPGRADDSTDHLFAGPVRKRLAAEQLVDSLFVAAGKSFRSETLSMDPEGRRPASEMLNLGTPTRAWQFTSLSNERDRPALALPMAQSIVDLLLAYGWRDSRQNPITQRDETATPLQPLLLAHGAAANRIVRLSDDSRITALCLEDVPLDQLVGRLFQTVLTRRPSAAEALTFETLLAAGYADRRIAGAKAINDSVAANTSSVSWANHLSPEATKIKLELERAARAGDRPTARLRKEWRERCEDVVWTLINSPEFMFVP